LALRQGGKAMAEVAAVTKPSSDPEKPPPSAGARRMRRHRERRRWGLLCVATVLRHNQVEGLIRRGWLGREERTDVKAVQKALYCYLFDTLG
jgi:hypothetical protein